MTHWLACTRAPSVDRVACSPAQTLPTHKSCTPQWAGSFSPAAGKQRLQAYCSLSPGGLPARWPRSHSRREDKSEPQQASADLKADQRQYWNPKVSKDRHTLQEKGSNVGSDPQTATRGRFLSVCSTTRSASVFFCSRNVTGM